MKIRVFDRYNLDVEETKEQLILSFGYNPNLIAEIKVSLDSPRWSPEDKVWTCRNSTRTRYLLTHVWRDSPQFNRYYTDPTELVTDNTTWDSMLYPSQIQFVNLAYYRKRMIHCGEMGVGKTLSIIALLDILAHRNKIKGDILWVGTKTTLKALDAEMKKWKPCVRPSYVINYESLHLLYKKLDKPPQIVIFDESTALKTPSSNVSKCALDLVEKMEEEWFDETYVFLMTGTPTTKDFNDWWMQCEVCRPGFLKEGSWYKFRERYFNLMESEVTDELTGTIRKFMKIDTPKDEEVAKFPIRVKGLVYRNEKVDLGIELPRKNFVKVICEPTPEILEVAGMLAATEETPLVILSKLRQYSDGFQYVKGEETISVECPKDQKLIELLRIHEQYHRFIIYAAYTESINRCVTTCRMNGWSVIRVDGRGWKYFYSQGVSLNPPDYLLKRFQEFVTYPENIAFVAHPLSAGKGLTLTASPSICFYSNDFRAESRWQAIDRIHRPTSRGANIYDLVHLPTDQLILDNLENKREVKDITLDEIRRLYAEKTASRKGIE